MIFMSTNENQQGPGESEEYETHEELSVLLPSTIAGMPLSFFRKKFDFLINESGHSPESAD
jgi:hypothetical protein